MGMVGDLAKGGANNTQLGDSRMWAKIPPGLSLESMSLGPENEGTFQKRTPGLSEGDMCSGGDLSRGWRDQCGPLGLTAL